jgi:hypothetical protein
MVTDVHYRSVPVSNFTSTVSTLKSRYSRRGTNSILKSSLQHSGEGKAGASNKRGASTVIQIRPAKRLKTSPLQAQQSSDANMANSTGEREERPRMYKKTRVVCSSNTEEKEETEEGETEESEDARQWEDTCV